MRVSVEGNIGSGKSTALRALARLRPDLRTWPEPVEEWRPWLAAFYADPAAGAFPLSLKVLASFSRVPADGRVLVERSPAACRHVFSQLLFNEGKLTPAQWDVFKEYADVLGWEPDAVVYVHVPADECLDRIARRGRPEEAGIDLHYLRRLEFQYETMLRYSAAPVVRVDASGKSADEVAAAVAAAVEAV